MSVESNLMAIFLGFAFLSGLVTIFAPCIWPLLPIILSSAAGGGRSKPLGITLGIMLSFLFFTLSISYLVQLFHLDSNLLRLFAVIVIGFLGLSLVIPALSARLEILVSRFSGAVGGGPSTKGSGFLAGLITGCSLGIVWSPCAGPILATIATLAATQAVNARVVLVASVYVLGVGIPLFIFASFGSWLFTRSRFLSPYTGRIQQVFGVIMILTAAAIYTNYDKVLQTKLLNTFPAFSTSLNRLESAEAVKAGLNVLKKKGENSGTLMASLSDSLPKGGPAPEFAGITKWLNTSAPLTLSGLRKKVVLVDFWTYTCINCIRTLPHVTRWYDEYKDRGLVVVGVHTPEFEFEKNTRNVQQAIEQYHIHYPVAQDNNYATWKAYDNEYWPAEYLIDGEGRIRRTHFGEGEYEETEEAIRSLLAEQGESVAGKGMKNIADETPKSPLTPETYLGSSRMERFSSKERMTGGTRLFMLPARLPLHHFAYQGEWDVKPESAGARRRGSALEINFYASKVFLVMTPRSRSPADEVKIYLDGEVIPQSAAGKDVKMGRLRVFTSRLYDLVDLRGKTENHRLRLEFENFGTSVFAFTFG